MQLTSLMSADVNLFFPCINARGAGHMGVDKWTANTPDPLGSFHSVAYGNSVGSGQDEFVAVGPVSRYRSPDGANWKRDTVPEPAPGQPTMTEPGFYSVAYGGGVFVAVGAYNKYRWDGLSWSGSTGSEFLRAVAYGRVPLSFWKGHGPPPLVGLFVAVGDAGKVVTSSDGVTWLPRSSGTTQDFKFIAYGDQLFVAAPDSGTASTLTSANGVNWTNAPIPKPSPTTNASYLRTLTFDSNRFVGVTTAKQIVTSSDGSNWTYLASNGLAGSGQAETNIAYGFDTYVVIGAKSSIRSSLDATSWTTPSSIAGSEQFLYGIAYGKNRFVVAGAAGEMLRSGEHPSLELSDLKCSVGRLTQAGQPTLGFDPSVTGYTAERASRVNVATVTPFIDDKQAKIHVRLDSGSDELVPSGTPSTQVQIPPRRAPYTFYVTVTARNNATKVYTVVVYQALPKWGWWPF